MRAGRPWESSPPDGHRIGREHRTQRLEANGHTPTQVEVRAPPGDAVDLREEAVMPATCRVLERPGRVQQDEVCGASVRLAPQHPPEALDEVAPRPERGQREGDVRVREVDTLVEHARRSERDELPPADASEP